MGDVSVVPDDVLKAASRICSYIRKTPLLESETLNRHLGFRLLVKAEGEQETGAFKFRGGLNNLLLLSAEEKRRGVVAGSAGNHAKGLACAGQILDVPVTILMPDDAPQIKVRDTRGYGATVEFVSREGEDRDVVVGRMADERRLKIIHSYNNLNTIAAHGTIGLEIQQQCAALDCQPDAILVNCSGGGLAAGIAVSRGFYEKPPQIITTEPEKFDDAKRSFETGIRQTNAIKKGSICDALLLSLGDLTFPILQHHQARGLTASDSDVQAAMSLYADEFKLVVEPGGAVSLAAACLNRDHFKGRTVVVVASGSNVDRDAYAEHLRVGRLGQSRLLSATL